MFNKLVNTQFLYSTWLVLKKGGGAGRRRGGVFITGRSSSHSLLSVCIVTRFSILFCSILSWVRFGKLTPIVGVYFHPFSVLSRGVSIVICLNHDDPGSESDHKHQVFSDQFSFYILQNIKCVSKPRLRKPFLKCKFCKDKCLACDQKKCFDMPPKLASIKLYTSCPS